MALDRTTFTIVMLMVVLAPLILLFLIVLRIYRDLTVEDPEAHLDMIPETLVCRYCGEVLMREWRHCPRCGREAEPPPPSRAALDQPTQVGPRPPPRRRPRRSREFPGAPRNSEELGGTQGNFTSSL